MTGRTGSLRLRLLLMTLLALCAAMLAAYVWLGIQFREHLTRQFDSALSWQLDQVTARLQWNDQGQPQMPVGALSDPRWERPYSGLYWQVDRIGAKDAERHVVLRSRSLWDAQLGLPGDALADGEIHAHELQGPRDEALRVLERRLRTGDAPDQRWRIMVGSDTRDLAEATAAFQGVLGMSLASLGLLLALAGWVQISVGLAPLRRMQGALQAVRDGRTRRMDGSFPTEVQPLIDDFNRVIDQNEAIIERARAQAGNLAHALKTPLAVIANAVQRPDEPRASAALISEQLALAQQQIDRHLARARAAASLRTPGQRTAVEPLLTGLLRVMGKVHAERAIGMHLGDLSGLAGFAGEEQDLREMLGNLLDNACLSAHANVWVNAETVGRELVITIADDGPGIAEDKRAAVLQRGTRLDESRPGNGLGLAIVQELATLYEGHLELDAREGGGLVTRLTLPSTADPR